MKKITFFLTALILMLGINSNAQWVQMSNGMGNDKHIRAFIMKGDNIFAGINYGGVYLSTNYGQSWTQTTLNNRNGISLAVSGNNIFAGTDHYGVYLSTNNGQSWTQTTLNNRTVYSLAASGNNIFAGLIEGGGGVYLSTNNGTTWTLTTLNNRDVISLAVNGNNIFAGTLYDQGIYLSTNNGQNWTQTALNNQTVRSLAVSGNNIFASTESSGVYLSTNNGQTWTQTALNNGRVWSLAISGNNIFAGTDNGAYLSTNNGVIWTQINHGFNTVPSVFSLFNKDNFMFAGTNLSIWRYELSLPLMPTPISPANYSIENPLNLNLIWSKSQHTTNYNVVLATDSTFTNIVLNDYTLLDTFKTLTNLTPLANYYWKVRSQDIYSQWGPFSPYFTFGTSSPWYPMYSGITNNNVNAIAANGSNIFAGTMGGVFLSTNNGLNWTAANNGLTSLNVKALIFNGSNLFAGTEGGGIFLSANNGGFWIAVNSGLYSQSITSLITSGSNIFAGTTSGVYRSTNNGGNWISAGLSYTDINSLYLNGSVIYAGTSNGLYFTANNGANWYTTFGTMNVNSIAISSANLFIGTTAGVFLSTNNGNNWIASWLTNQNVNALIINGNRIFAGTDTGGVFLSTNNGINWLQKNQGFDTVPSVHSFLTFGNYIYAGTVGQSVWRRDLNYIIGISTISNLVPKTYSLSQNFPNPFNPSTKIRFDVLKSDIVTIKVFDVLGREITTLVKESLKPGTYQVEWDGSSFASGVYYYKLISGDFVETKKMILLK